MVTGATAGIGLPTCLALGRSGARIVALGRNPERVSETAKRIASETGAIALGIAADVRSAADVEHAVERVLARFGRIDILVACAGILRPNAARTLQTLSRMSASDWDEVIDTNLKGVFLCNRSVLPAMIRQREGHIVNLSSTSGRKAYAFDSAYCASKFAVIGLSESVADEVRGFGVKVEALLPGAIDTGMWDQNGPFRRPDHALAPERVAECIVATLSLPRDTQLSNVRIEPTAKPGGPSILATAAEQERRAPVSSTKQNGDRRMIGNETRTENGHRQNGEGRVAGRVALVTGGASGIGRATARTFAEEGARVVVADFNSENVAATLAELESIGPGEHLGLTVDVRNEAEVEDMARAVEGRFGRIDVLVCCAAVLRGTGSIPRPLHTIEIEEWDQVLDTNLRGMFLCNRAVVPGMIRRRHGDIVNLSSVSGKQGRAHDAPYCASKFGVIGMSESLAEEVRSYGVRVQIVIPDAVRTPMWDQNGPVPCPPDALPPERVASLILSMVTLPADTILLGATIAPLRARKRAKKDRTPSEETTAVASE
jgi:NAD(P)-dependent dehydrogenase (short-subunit alcohol dehydrogenase family)